MLLICVLLIVGLCTVFCIVLRAVSEDVYSAGKYIVGNYTFLFQHNFWRDDLPTSLPEFAISSGEEQCRHLRSSYYVKCSM